jgi:hypothetical protein
MFSKDASVAVTRRQWLSTTLQLAAIGSLPLVVSGCGKTSNLVCANPALLSDADNSLRESLHYSEKSPRDDQKCSGCGFFGAEQGPCGSCRLLKGPVNPMGRCDSWSAANK